MTDEFDGTLDMNEARAAKPDLFFDDPSTDYRSALVEQVRRDMETLRDPTVDEDPAGRAFYEQRIVDYRAVIKKMDASGG